MPEETNSATTSGSKRKAGASKTGASKAGASKAVFRVKRVRSAIRRPQDQKDTLRALGLERMNKLREFPDNPSVRGMVAKVAHLVQVEGADGKNNSKKSS